jgi:hypothetical protein
VALTEAGCGVDSSEPNDTAATPESLDTVVSAIIPGVEEARRGLLTLCGEDDDWFSVELGPTERVRANVYYDPQQGNLDLRLFAPGGSGTSLAADLDSASTGLLDIDYTLGSSAVAGDYLLVVESAGTGLHENAYSLEVLVNRSCMDDRYAPSTISHPTSVSLPAAPLAYGSMVLCDDEDWFAVTVAGGGPWSVCARFLHEVADLDLEAYAAADLGTPVSWSRTKNDEEELLLTAVAGTTYYVRAYLDFRSPDNTGYGMWILPGGGGCPDACADLVRNGDESDVDCGGSCTGCTVGYACDSGGDCQSGNCVLGLCR